jgi:hypothetical protein
MREIIFCRGCMKKSILMSAFFAFFVVLLCETFVVFPQITHNSMGEMCMYIGQAYPRESFSEERRNNTFVKINNRYIAYDPDSHTSQNILYEKKSEIDLNKADLEVNESPCVLTSYFYSLIIGIFFLSFVPSFLFFFFWCYVIKKVGKRFKSKISFFKPRG